MGSYSGLPCSGINSQIDYPLPFALVYPGHFLFVKNSSKINSGLWYMFVGVKKQECSIYVALVIGSGLTPTL